MPTRTTARHILGTVVVLIATLGWGTGVASAKPAATNYQNYVALGDSYTSGPLIPWTRLSPLGCARSTNNYPSWLAYRLNVAKFTDVSCGGATTENLTTSQSVPLWGTNRPQFNALNRDTDLVTMGMGGNDFGVFGSIVGTCPSLRDSDPTGSPCRAHFTVNGVDTLLANISKTQGRLTEAVRGIHQRSPKATVLLIGYPRIAPATGTCPSVLPFADGDLRYLDRIEQALNRAVRNAAEANNATYVDTYTPSTHHDACSDDNAWVNGQSTNVFRALSYHPFRVGMMAEANIIHQVLGRPTTPGDSHQAAPPSAEGSEQSALRAAEALDVRNGSTGQDLVAAGIVR